MSTMAALYNVFTVRFLETDFNTRTMSVTLQLSLYYSTYQIFNSHVKSSHVDFLFPFVLLKLTASLLASAAYYYCLGNLHTYICSTDTHHRKHVTCSLSSQSIGALAGPTYTTCHVFAIQPVHWCAGWTYRKHVT
jgi:hypothetical protein